MRICIFELLIILLLLGKNVVVSGFARSRLNKAVVFSTTSSASISATKYDSADGQLDRFGDGRGISSAELRKSESRRLRLQQEESIRTRFVSGDDLHRLRQRVYGLRNDLEVARKTCAYELAHELEQTILKAQQLDAEFVYSVALERVGLASQLGNTLEVERYRRKAEMARQSLPQFNLEGLWVGKYSEEAGIDMINVTYVGDTLIAYKVTGERNVPKGKMSFSVDLSPTVAKADLLEPIELGAKAAQQWGSKFLQRFSGRGQVAARDFTRHQYMEGQLILVNQYFSFAWLPISHQVFFGRPSPELTLKLLRRSWGNRGDCRLREYLSRCWQESEMIEDEMEASDGLFRSHEQGYYYDQGGHFE